MGCSSLFAEETAEESKHKKGYPWEKSGEPHSTSGTKKRQRMICISKN